MRASSGFLRADAHVRRNLGEASRGEAIALLKHAPIRAHAAALLGSIVLHAWALLIAVQVIGSEGLKADTVGPLLFALISGQLVLWAVLSDRGWLAAWYWLEWTPEGLTVVTRARSHRFACGQPIQFRDRRFGGLEIRAGGSDRWVRVPNWLGRVLIEPAGPSGARGAPTHQPRASLGESSR